MMTAFPGREVSDRVRWLEDDESRASMEIDPSPNHPSRAALTRLLGGDRAAAGELQGLYDEQASDWHAWSARQPDYVEAVHRALALTPVTRGIWLEICCGTGEATGVLRGVSRDLVVMDGSLTMISSASGADARLVCDVGSLALKSGVIAAVVGLNAVPLVVDVPRVLDEQGWLVLAYSFANHTPLYAEPEAVLDQLGSEWSVDCARGPWGEFQYFARR